MAAEAGGIEIGARPFRAGAYRAPGRARIVLLTLFSRSCSLGERTQATRCEVRFGSGQPALATA